MQNKECYNNIFQDERDLPFVPPAPHPGHDFDLFSLKNISILMMTSRKENNYKISEITCIHYKGKCILKILLCWIFGILIKQNHQKHCEMFTEISVKATKMAEQFAALLIEKSWEKKG